MNEYTRLAFWKGAEKDKEKENKEEEKEEAICLPCLNVIGKNTMKDKRKEPGLPTAFKQHIYDIFF